MSLPTNQRARILLVLFGLAGGAQTQPLARYTRQELVDILWPGSNVDHTSDYEKARTNINLDQALTSARRALGIGGGCLRSRSGVVSLRRDNGDAVHIQSDADDLSRLSLSPDRGSLISALRLVRGQIAAGTAEPAAVDLRWLAAARKRHKRTVESVLDALGCPPEHLDEQVIDTLAGRSEAVLRDLARAHGWTDTDLHATPDDSDDDVVIPAMLVVRALRIRYPSGPSLDRLADLILTDQPAITAAEVVLTLSDTPYDALVYDLVLQTRVTMAATHYYLALTARATLSSYLVSNCGAVAEVFACSDVDDVQERARSLQEEPGTLCCIVKDARGKRSRTSITLAVSNDATKARVLQGVSPAALQEILLLDAALPPSHTPPEVELRLRSTMQRSDHYCYWLCDRPTFVSRMIVDATRLTLPAGQRFRLRPCMAASDYEMTSEGGRYVLDLDSWLIRGQGLVLVWG